MKKPVSLLAVALLSTSVCLSQSVNPEPSGADLPARKSLLLTDLQSLEISSFRLEQPLARAAAQAEIASAAWTLDEAWSKRLLREAYELTMPPEGERERLRGRKIGAALTPPSGGDTARTILRSRVIGLASRDRAFADELIKFGAQQLGSLEQHYNYAHLGEDAARAGDLDVASSYARQAFDAEPTLLNAGVLITDVASRDRRAGDQLIIRYVERLRSLPLSVRDHSAMRVYLLLDTVIFYYYTPFFSTPTDEDRARIRQTKPPGAEAMRAYLTYLVESMTDMERHEPGTAQRMRGRLAQAWEPLRRYAPELTSAFNELERMSRKPGDDTSLKSLERRREDSEKQYERGVKDALDSDYPDEMVIHSVISRGDFVKARKLIGKLPDGTQKTQLLETVNAREARALSAKGDAAGAEQLAERLRNATFILQVYPPLLKACVASKEQACPARLVYQSVRQLKRADTTPIAPPAGIPASAVPTNRELDRVLLSLSQLAAQVAPASDALALELLDEIVEAANRSESDTGQGRTGFDAAVFKLLAAKHEARARQAAEGFRDRLRRIVALATIYRVKAEELSKTVEGSDRKKIDAAGGDAKPKP